MNINVGHSDDEHGSLAEDALEALTAFDPTELMQALRSWLAGSLSLVHLHVLAILRAGGPESMSRLADALDVSVASASGIVDRMERRGLVERRPDPDDRRVVVVHMLERGTDIFRQLAGRRRGALRRLLDRLTEEELAALLTGLRALRAAREAQMAEPAPPDAEGTGSGRP